MLPYVMAWLNRFQTDEEGQGMVEYALILVLISVVAIVAMRAVGVQVTAVFDSIATALTAA